MTKGKALAGCVVVLAALVGVVLTQAVGPAADDKEKTVKDKPPGEKAEAKKKTVKVERKTFRIELAVKGVLEPEQAVEIAHRPRPILESRYHAGSLKVRSAVAHGTSARKGDTLVAFDTRLLDQVLKQMETDLQVVEAGIKLAAAEQPLLAKSAPFEIEAAERAKLQADEDLDYFLKTARPEAEKQVRQMMKTYAFFLWFAKEELRQLEKMYKANDLTEETEELILKRQRFSVERAENWYKQMKIERDHILKTELPRKEKSLHEAMVKQSLALEKAKNTLEPLVAQKMESLAKMRFDRDKLRERLQWLHKDREAMTLTAPCDGIVYYGKFSQGHWESATALAGKLVADGAVSPDEVLMTIVKSRPLLVRLAIDEKEAHLVKTGLKGRAQMVFNPDLKIGAEVTKISAVPAAPGKFEALVSLKLGSKADSLMPGMACAVKFVPYVSKDAIAVPSSAVFEEDDKHFVRVVDRDGKEEQREVTPGRSSDDRTEITSGLSVGEEILLEGREEKKAAPAAGGDK